MKPLLTAGWTRLAVATFEADAQLLTRYLPHRTELNDWNGRYYMSLLGFVFSKPVIAGIPSPFYRCFPEVNLRFYIRYRNSAGWQNAVVFIKEIAPSPLIGLAARWLYHENFISLPMKHHFSTDGSQQRIAYYWKIKNEWNHLKLVAAPAPAEPAPGSLEAFARDHYHACTRSSAQRTHAFRIEHQPWQIYPGRSCSLLLDAAAVYGKAFGDYFRQPPCSYFSMDGSGTDISYPSLL
ncbi:MAG: DUF2071 domain-containing protein [Chitinophagaceae bacterium]